jgi:hypothetical protein
MQINSSKVSINNSSVTTYKFLCNANNYEKLMPESISKFEAYDDTKFLFALKGMPEIILKQADSNPNEYIKFIAGGGKIDFSLLININEIDSNYCELDLKFEGDFNPMMAMMIKKPITSFLETLVSNASKTI